MEMRGPLSPAGEIASAGCGYLPTKRRRCALHRGSLEAWLCRAIAAMTLHLENNA
jgi:hypothetical protein